MRGALLGLAAGMIGGVLVFTGMLAILKLMERLDATPIWFLVGSLFAAEGLVIFAFRMKWL